MDFPQTAADDLERLMRWRRDVRHFQTDPVPEALLTRVLAQVDLAPSVGNSRPWRLVLVRDTSRRAAITALFEAANAEAAAGYDETARAEYMRLKLAGLREAPEHLAVFTLQDPAEGRGLGRQTMPETLGHSTAMAIHTIWLAARAVNLGVGWVSILDPIAVAQVLGVPDEWRLTGYLCIGWPAGQDDMPLIHRAGWQGNTASEVLIR